MTHLGTHRPTHALAWGFAAIALLASWCVVPFGRAQSAPGSFVNFESGYTRPLALSPDGTRLFALNTPDGRLAIFDVTTDGLTLAGEVQVGVDPVAVAARTNLEVWVVNHLSDSVSIVRIDDAAPSLSEVTNTLLTCDEPRDIVFAGNRAFVTTARRGQNCPVDPMYDTPGIGRALVQVFDATALGAPLGGTPIANIELFADTPRGLAVTPDGTTVYAAAFHSGNQTTTILEPIVTIAGGLPPPPAGSTPGGPNVGLIVKFNQTTGTWEDERGAAGVDWSPAVMFSLPDLDVFEIDADAATPAAVGSFPHVGTVLFNLAVHPTNGKVYVSNTDARNHVRFEGIFPSPGSPHGVRGHIAESRISILDGGFVSTHHLNPHIDYTQQGTPAEAADTFAFPTDLTFSSDGSRLYVAGFGTGQVGVFDSADLEAGVITKDLIHVGGGAGGLALDESRDRLYVLSRFEQRVKIVTNVSDETKRGVTGSSSLHFDPSPASTKAGRPFLYDTLLSSGHGDSSCASCHIFGDFDSLAWDLGDASNGAPILPNPNPFVGGATGNPFHPLKGPMTTQSLRGMAGFGPMHWRGDRTGGHLPGGDPLDEDAAFKAFNPAFVGLLGRAEELTEEQMQAFTDFILAVPYPPNPNRSLDNVLNASEQAGEDFFLTQVTDGGNTCDGCHTFPFGADGRSTFEGETQEFKVAHQRNMYQKVGMFGVPPAVAIPPTGFLGDQVRGFGFLHDGGIASLFDFVSAQVFANLNDPMRRNLENFMLASESSFVPAVGQQVSNTPANFTDPDVVARLDVLVAQAEAGDCDLIIKGLFAGEPRGAVYLPGGQFRSDRAADPLFGAGVIRGLPGQGATQVYTCVPPGAGARLGIDRDSDGAFDADERDAGTDPDDPNSVPGGTQVVDVESTAFKMLDDHSIPINPNRKKLVFKSSTKKSPAANRIVAPLLGQPGDPTIGGGTLRVYNAAGGAEQVTLDLPAAGWRPVGSGGWLYRGTGADPVTTILVKDDTIRIKAKGPNWPYTLDEVRQGRLGLRLTLADAIEWCADTGARITGKKPTTERTDLIDKFLGAKKTPASASCAIPPEGA